MEDTLIITIKNEKPMELNQFTVALNAFSSGYESFLKNNYPSDHTKGADKLYMIKVEKGSIIIELASALISLVPEANCLFDFVSHLKDICFFLLGKNTEPKYFRRDELGKVSKICELARNKGNTLVIQNNTENISVSINHIEANAIQNEINRLYSEQNQDESLTSFNKVCMCWANTSFKQQNVISDKVMIEEINPLPKKAIFINDIDKKTITNHNQKFPEINWQDLMYVVDVDVVYKNGNLVAYKITKLYPEDTFYPE